ncbi:MAG: hypothetical protein M9921_13655 [Fimbriimonadaceae bacterium]|nr:hypothetical protein [Fimbriimonadaceae bacterium]
MIGILAALCLAGSPGIQEKSLLHQIVPHPTGRNAYEEYLKAADLVLEGDAALYLDWQEGDLERLESEARGGNVEALRRLPQARRLGTMSVLEVRREAVARFGAALDWVRQGNGKPVLVPVGDRQKFPEMKHFRELAELAVVTAYVRDSEGKTGPGTDALLDAIDMGDRIGGSVGVAFLSGVLMQTFGAAAMGQRLHQLSLGDALATIEFVDRILQRPPSVQRCLEAHIHDQDRRWRDLLTKPISLPGEERGDALLRLVSQLGPEERARLSAYLSRHHSESFSAIANRFSGPESGWVAADPEVMVSAQPRTVEEIGDAIIATVEVRPSLMGTSAARMRTQLRLLGLAARVIAFKWEHERLPTRLEDAAPAAELDDPLSGDKFQYTPMGDRFRVFSKGVPATGEIDIKYVRGQGTGGPPPPQQTTNRRNEGSRLRTLIPWLRTA